MKQRSLLSRIASTILLGLILTFALTTVGNVSDFVHRYHAGWTGWSLGLAFGATVFLTSYVAATAYSSKTRWIALAISTVFAISSGVFQVNLYMAGDAPLLTAIILSFIPITVGEAGLALLESSYSKDHEIESEILLSDQLKLQVDRLEIELKSAQDYAISVGDELQSQLELLQDEIETAHATIANLTNRNEVLQDRISQMQVRPAQPQPVKSKSEPASISADDISEFQVEILRAIANNADIQQKEIAEILGSNPSKISREIKPMKDGGVIEIVDGKFQVHPEIAIQLNGRLAG